MPRALLIDFGGVLTVSLIDAFAELSRELGLPPKTALAALSKDPEARVALVEHETGKLDDEGFEAAYAAALVRAGGEVEADGLIARITSRLTLDDAMVDLVRRARAAGVPVALVSNSLGRDGYSAIDLDELFDVAVISGKVGVRKPSRAIYRIACEQLGVDPAECVLVDDLQQNLDGAARLGITGVLHRDAAHTVPEVERLLGMVPTGSGATPQTERGRRTRDNLVRAARAVFERDGYVESRLVDITAEAHCSIGTFYTWFESKEAVFAAVVEQAQHEMLHPGTGRFAAEDDPAAVIAESNRAYFEAYARNARLNQMLNQVATVDPRFRAMRRARSEAFIARNARAIADLQARGLADRELDPHAASMALSGMVGRLAADTYTYDLDLSVDLLVDTATRLWTNALGLTSPRLEADPTSGAEAAPNGEETTRTADPADPPRAT